MKNLRLVMGQLDFVVGNAQVNATKVITAAKQAREERGAHVIIFPELCLSGYPPEDLLLRPSFAREIEAALTRVQHEVHGIDVIVGHPHRAPDGLYNAASLIRDGEIIATYHKQVLPNYGVFDEKRYFVAGVDACVVEVRGVRVGITVCEDIWAAAPAQKARDAGAQVLVNLNASPYHRDKTKEREQVVVQRTRETGLALVYVNLVGGQDELVFDGESFVVNASGEITQRAPAFTEGLFVVELQPGTPAQPSPAIINGHLSAEESVYRALILGLRDYVHKNHFSGAVLGLSGGVDSALTLALAVDALGAEHVQAVMMPSRYTAAMSLEDARSQAAALGVRYSIISIEPMFAAFAASLADEFRGLAADVTEENIQARIRGVLLMALSNKTGKIVITTGNKSEMAVGYATLYGDMAGGFAAIKDVPKTLVYRLAAYRNAVAPVIPERVLTRAPSAELAPDQKDEDSLPPYAVLDPILEKYIECDWAAEDIIAAGFDSATVRRVIAMVHRNEYKRRQAPPGIRITPRAFGRDWRYPITTDFGKK